MAGSPEEAAPGSEEEFITEGAVVEFRLRMSGPRPSRWKSPWTWIGLSCGVWVLIGLMIFVFVSLRTLNRYSEVRGRVREEPVLIAAEMVALKDRDLKVVSRDPKGHTVTLRNQKTGERIELGQVGKDRLRIRTEAGEVVPDFAGPGALLSGRDREGWLRLGSAAGLPPSWVPAPPGAQARPLYSLRVNGVVSGCFKLTLKGSVKDTLAFYQDELGRRGFAVTPAVGSVSASSPDASSSLFVIPSTQAGRPGLLLTWSELPPGNR